MLRALKAYRTNQCKTKMETLRRKKIPANFGCFNINDDGRKRVGVNGI